VKGWWVDWTERKREGGGGRGGGRGGGGEEEGRGGGEAEGGGGGGARREGTRSRRNCEGYKIGSTSCSMEESARILLEYILNLRFFTVAITRYMYIKISLYLDMYLHSQKKVGIPSPRGSSAVQDLPAGDLSFPGRT